MKTSSASSSMKLNSPVNRLVGDMPKVGIPPTIDGRLQCVRESLEKTTMAMAQIVAKLIASTLRHPNGLIGSICIMGWGNNFGGRWEHLGSSGRLQFAEIKM